jgi:hypothetical protein
MTAQQVTFNIEMHPSHIYAFRGAFIDMVRSSTLSLKEKEIFSNKVDDGYRGKPKITYPLIQYRCSDDLAQIWAMNEGVHALHKVIDSDVLQHFTIANQAMPLEVVHMQEENMQLSIDTHKSYCYQIKQYVPLSKEKKIDYGHQPTYIDKIKMLEQLLLNELVLLTYACHLKDSPRISVSIIDIIDKYHSSYHTKNNEDKVSIDLDVYNLTIRTNMRISPGLSIGRHKAYGYGIVHPIE